MRWPRLMESPSSTRSRAPYWIRWTARSYAVIADNDDGDVAAHGDEITIGVARDIAVAQLHRALEGGFDEGGIRDLCRTTDMEGAHGELCTRSPIDWAAMTPTASPMLTGVPSGEIAPVAGGADTVLGLADENRADLDLLDTCGVDLIDMAFLDHRPLRHDDLAVRIDHILAGSTPEDTRGECRDDLTGIDDGAHRDALLGAAIVLPG